MLPCNCPLWSNQVVNSLPSDEFWLDTKSEVLGNLDSAFQEATESMAPVFFWVQAATIALFDLKFKIALKAEDYAGHQSDSTE